MAVYDLDHVTLGVSHLYEGAERLRRRTGLRSVEGGWLTGMPTAHRTVPLPGGAYINIESVISRPGDLPPGVGVFAGWFEETTRQGDHWMSWNLRARDAAGLEDVARRLGGEVVTAPGAHRPDGTTVTTVMAPGNAGMTWARGLPNFYLHEDGADGPGRPSPAMHERPLHDIAWIEVGGDPAELEEHVGPETFAVLPLRFVEGATGLHGIGLRTTGGDEIALRAPSAAPALAALAARIS